MALTDPLYNEIDATNLESVRKNVVYDQLFVGTPFQQKMRRAGVVDPFLGGSAMVEVDMYGHVQGAALAPGSTVTVTRNAMLSARKYFPKAYATWWPMDDWEVDDGSGQGGVINSGPSRIANLYQIILENETMTMNTMLEMDGFRHGQSSGTGVADDRRFNSNGLDEALNNGVDPSPFGNVYTTYGSATRNGVYGPGLNSTPLYLGTKQGGVGQIDVNALTEMWARCQVTGGKPDIGITGVWGFKAVVNALDAQRRNTDMKKFDIDYQAVTFNGIEIYADPLAPSAQAANYIALAPAPGKAGNNTLVDGSGQNTQTVAFTSPQFKDANGNNISFSLANPNLPSATTIQPGEVLYFLQTSDFKIRDTDKPGWNFGLRRNPLPNNISVDALFMRLATNLYNNIPRHSCVAYAFGS